MRIRSLFVSIAALALAGTALALEGEAEFTVPKDAIRCTWVIRDSDVFWDDTLATGALKLPKENPGGGKMTIPFGALHCNDDGDVAGPLDDSGESTAEIYVEITFYFEGGGTNRQRSKPKKVTCESTSKTEAPSTPTE